MSCELKQNKIYYEYKRHREQNSRYLDNESRRNIYKVWLKEELREQNRKLHNACSKALAIYEATANVEESRSRRVKRGKRK